MTEKELTVYDLKFPDDLIERLQQNTEDEDKARWDDGDVTADIVDEFGEQYGKGLVRKRVAIEAGLSSGTIRQREDMSRFFAFPDRVIYDVLTWSQLRACKPAGIDWRDLADWAIESADDFGGRPAPVDAIVAKRLSDDGKLPPTWKDKLDKVMEALSEIVTMDDVPKDVIDAVEKFRRETAAGRLGEAVISH
jgi:hypothetical protein